MSRLDFYVNDEETGTQKESEIELSHLSILSTGESWYNRMGFYASNFNEEHPKNLSKIKQSIETIMAQKNNLRMLRLAKDKYSTQTCYNIINPNKNLQPKQVETLEKIKEIYEFILSLTHKTNENSVQEVFTGIISYIKENCNSVNKTCNISYETMNKITCFLDITYILLDLEYTKFDLIYIIPKKGGKKRKTNKKKKNKTNKNKK
jgi:hypothetical protein